MKAHSHKRKKEVRGRKDEERVEKLLSANIYLTIQCSNAFEQPYYVRGEIL